MGQIGDKKTCESEKDMVAYGMNGEPQPTYIPGVLVTEGRFFETQIEAISDTFGKEKIAGRLINIGFGVQSNFLHTSATMLERFADLTKIIGIDPSGENYVSEDGKIEAHNAFGVTFLAEHPEIRGNFVVAVLIGILNPMRRIIQS